MPSQTLITGFGEQKIIAERAKQDINGNSLELTIEGDSVTAIGGKTVGGGGGGGRYTPVTIDMATSQLVTHTGGRYTVAIPQNNAFVSLTNIPYTMTDLDVVLPSVAQNELVDIVVEGHVETDPNPEADPSPSIEFHAKRPGNEQNPYLTGITNALDAEGGAVNEYGPIPIKPFGYSAWFQIYVLGSNTFRAFVEPAYDE